jgi:hypothetical protein
MATNLRPADKQHTVTKRLLKEFSDSQGQLAVYERGHRTRQLRTPGAGIFTAQFDAFDSRGAEALWNQLETRFPRALSRVEARSALQDTTTVSTVKDILALHWARSRAIMEAREPITDQVIEDSKRHMLITRPDLLARGLKEEVGLVPASQADLAWINDVVHDRVVKQNRVKWHSDRNIENFRSARVYFDTLDVQVGYANGRDLVIGDCPVITTRHDRPGTGPHQGIALKEADHIAMPIMPGVVLGLGPETAILDLPDDVVDTYNDWQWKGHHTWIAAQPGGSGDLWLKEASRSR